MPVFFVTYVTMWFLRTAIPLLKTGQIPTLWCRKLQILIVGRMLLPCETLASLSSKLSTQSEWIKNKHFIEQGFFDYLISTD